MGSQKSMVFDMDHATQSALPHGKKKVKWRSVAFWVAVICVAGFVAKTQIGNDTENTAKAERQGSVLVIETVRIK